MLKKIKDAVFSKYTVIFLCVLVVSLGIWFLGPYLALNNVSPLETVYARFALIIWLLLLMTFIFARLPLSPLIFILIAVVFWYVSPIFGTKTNKPFESETVRWISIGFLFLAYLIYAGFTLWRAFRNDPALVEKFFHKNKEKEVVAYKETAKIQILLNATLSRLKSMRVRKYLLKDLFTAKDAYLYQLPWYFVLGKSNSGKTTAIANSRLALPIPEQLAQAAKYTSLNTLGENTETCNFWLTNEALLIDSSGSYIDKNKDENIEASWFGLLKLLKKTRARNAVNGVIITLNTADLLRNEAAENLEMAAQIRNRLLQLKEEFGVVFPVYVCVTKTDTLPGFEEYFRSLTIEARDQVLGLTLPYKKNQKISLSEQVDQEVSRLILRLEQGIIIRLHEEFDLEHRQELYVFPNELMALAEKVKLVTNAIFSESKFDQSQENEFLRGIYFTSAGQTHKKIAAKNATLRQQIDAIASNYSNNTYSNGGEKLSSNRSFFLRDMFSKVIFTEAGLVKPNETWELRSKLLRACVYILIFAVFIWLSIGLYGSMKANEDYLDSTNIKVEALRQHMATFMANPKLDEIPDTLNIAADLPNYHNWNLDKPSWDVRYGLYTPPGIQAASTQTYNSLVDHLLLGHLTQRIEVAMQEAVAESSTEKAANALNVYLMLHTQDDDYYRADTIKNWVLQDWSQNDSAAIFGNKASMVEHLDRLFDGKRTVRSQYLPNDSLIKSVRLFLSTQSSTIRLYERAKDVMMSEAPEEYTLTKVVGPQAGMVFSRLSGAPLDSGVPGLFTYDGYHNFFDKRLDEFIGEAKKNDDWLMGRTSKDTPLTVSSVKSAVSNPLAQEIRKLYLAEYTKHWNDFLSDIGTVTGDNLTFDLTVLRVFAAPDSPLSRLARSVVRETTLSKPLDPDGNALLNAAAKNNSTANKINNAVNTANKYGFRVEEQLEKEMVDNHFADLREMVTGKADVQDKTAADAGGIAQASRMNLNYFSALINEYYTYLAMTETAINTGNVPQNADISLKMQLEAGKMPAPFSKILMTFVDSGVQKVNLGQSDIFRKHAEVQFNNLMNALSSQVTNICSDAIEGKYPFVKSSYEVSMEDFANIFGSGGVLDTFFTTRLQPSVDTNSRPWKYKTVEQLNTQQMIAATSSSTAVNPNTNTSLVNHPTLETELAKLLIKSGPDPEIFAQAQDIRSAFFQEPGGKKVALKLNYRMVEMDPSITELILNFDGQVQRYIHGPIQTITFKWPGAISGAEAEMTANPQIRRDTSIIRTEGPWALFKLLERGKLIKTASGSRTAAEFKLDDRRVLLDFSSESSVSPFNLDQLRKFSCPRIR